MVQAECLFEAWHACFVEVSVAVGKICMEAKSLH